MERLESQNDELKKAIVDMKSRVKDMKAQQDQLETMLRGVVDKLGVLVDDDAEDEEVSY